MYVILYLNLLQDAILVLKLGMDWYHFPIYAINKKPIPDLF